jgi:hypothetical protein
LKKNRLKSNFVFTTSILILPLNIYLSIKVYVSDISIVHGTGEAGKNKTKSCPIYFAFILERRKTGLY